MNTPAEIREWAALGGDRYPGAVWKPLPENATQPSITPRAFILHTQAGSKPATNAQVWSYMANATVTNEPTFLLQMDGLLWQSMGLFTRADSNYKANGWTLSVETQDMGAATLDQTPWTEAQLQVLAEICAYLNLHPGIRIPLQPVPSWDGAGVAPHNAFGVWSASAHSCPGRARTAQVPEVIARAKAIVDWTPPKVVSPPPPVLEEDVVKYTVMQAAGRNPALVAIDGSGITAIGLAADDLAVIASAYGAATINVNPATWDDIVAKSKADISPGA